MKGVKNIEGKSYKVSIRQPVLITKTGYINLKGGRAIVNYIHKGKTIRMTYNIKPGTSGFSQANAVWRNVKISDIGRISKIVKGKVVTGTIEIKPLIKTTIKKVAKVRYRPIRGIEFFGKVKWKPKIIKGKPIITKGVAIGKRIKKDIFFRGAEAEKLRIPLAKPKWVPSKKIYTAIPKKIPKGLGIKAGKYPVLGRLRVVRIPKPKGLITKIPKEFIKYKAKPVVLQKPQVPSSVLLGMTVAQRAGAAGQLGVSVSKAVTAFGVPKVTAAIIKKTPAQVAGVTRVKPAIKAVRKVEVTVKPTARLAVTPLEITKERVKYRLGGRLITRPKEKERVAVAPSLVQAQIPAVREKVIPKLRQLLLQKPRLKQRYIPLLTTRLRPIVRPKIIIPPPILFPKVEAAIKIPKKPKPFIIGKPKGFVAYVKRRKRWKAVSPVVKRGEAIWFGARKARETLAAAFKVRPVKRPITKRRYPALIVPSPKVFREYKIRKGKKIPLKDYFIQRRRFRLSAPSEVKEIQFARRRAEPFFKARRKRKRK